LDRNPKVAEIPKLGSYEDACYSENTPETIVTKEELNSWLQQGKQILIIDVSDPADIIKDEFPSVRIPSFEIASRLDEIPHDRPVVFVCPMGIKSQAVVNYLIAEHHYTNLLVLRRP
jgi:adenylyltransferase/sulfurtransferase